MPDSALIGLLVFLLGITVLVWSSTGLAGVFAHGAWPRGVTFGRTPLAIRHLAAGPHDLAGAWPDTPRAALSGYGLFWGLFIGQLMVLLVLIVFTLGTLTRWRAVRARRRAARHADADVYEEAASYAAPRADPHEQRRPARPGGRPGGAEPRPRLLKPAQEAADGVDGVDGGTPADVGEGTLAPGQEAPLPAPRSPLVLGPPAARRPLAIQAVRDAEGPVVVVTSDPGVWAETKDARAKLGPVLVYDPLHRCDTPARLHWSPVTGCEKRETAASRAAALLAPVRPSARLDAAVADTAETLLRCFLHAAAVDGRQSRHVHRWAQGTQVQEAVRTLRTDPAAAPGAAGELEAALTAHPQRRDAAQELTGRALAALSSVHIREACAPNRNDTLALDSFVAEGGTLYIVGEAIEDPRSRPAAMPFLTALASDVVEHGRGMAVGSSSGRLDPPLALVLDDVAAVAPLPQLPELLASGAELGLPTLALMRSREQGRARWPAAELPS